LVRSAGADFNGKAYSIGRLLKRLEFAGASSFSDVQSIDEPNDDR
jgi:hypothetical protein